MKRQVPALMYPTLVAVMMRGTDDRVIEVGMVLWDADLRTAVRLAGSLVKTDV